MFKKLATALSAVLLISCVNTSLENTPIGLPGDSVGFPLPEVVETSLPTAIESRVRDTYASEQQIPEPQVNILRFSRETWTDGCLGLGGSAESCLFALTEGWQVEATDVTGKSSRFYRTDLTGDQIRLSTLENNLPPSVSDRILQTLRASGMAEGNSLSIVAAKPQLWDGCIGLAQDGDVCTEIAIFGWRATATDTKSYWTYHTDGLGNTILLNELASLESPPDATIPPALEIPDDVSAPTELEVNDFSLEELLTQVDRGCSIILRHTVADTNFILHEDYLEGGVVTMKIADEWVTFSPESQVMGISQPIRTFVSEDNQHQLTVNTPGGKRIGYELTEIPNATIKIQQEDEPATILSAVGESGC